MVTGPFAYPNRAADCSTAHGVGYLLQQGLHTLGVVFLVAFCLGQFTLFTLAVIDEGLDGSHQEADAVAQPGLQERGDENGLNHFHSCLPPLA